MVRFTFINSKFENGRLIAQKEISIGAAQPFIIVLTQPRRGSANYVEAGILL